MKEKRKCLLWPVPQVKDPVTGLTKNGQLYRSQPKPGKGMTKKQRRALRAAMRADQTGGKEVGKDEE